VSVYRTPEARFAKLPAYPFTPHYADLDGLRMHYVDEGGDGEPVLLLHGEPTWSFLYRRMIPPLVAVGRVVAPDYIGFGRSDKPVDRDWYSYDAHYRSVERLVEELDLRRLTVVMQDWGGPIGARLAVSQPDRIARLVVMNTGLYSGRPPSDTWLQFRELVRRTGTEFDPGRLIQLTCVRGLADEVAAAYNAPFPTPESKTGVLMFPELVPTEPVHPSAGAMLQARDALGSWRKPTLVLFGDSDPIFSVRVAERIAAFIPGAEPAQTVAKAGHFLQEDAGEEVGSRIADWLKQSGS
jgi:haloalkane dehalogenase